MSFSRLIVHWGIDVKRRRPTFPASVDDIIDQTICDVLVSEGCRHIASGASVEHIHGLSELRGDKTISRISAEVKKALTSRLAELGIPARWTDGYWAFSVSPRDFEAVRRYVLNQRDHHANGYLLDEELKWFQHLCAS